MIESADDEPHLHCLTSSYVFIFPACKLTRDSWLVTCIGMQNEEKSTQFTIESCHVCSLLAFSIRIPSHTPNSGHLLLESNMAARYNSFACTKNRVPRLQIFTNREIKMIFQWNWEQDKFSEQKSDVRLGPSSLPIFLPAIMFLSSWWIILAHQVDGNVRVKQTQEFKWFCSGNRCSIKIVLSI